MSKRVRNCKGVGQGIESGLSLELSGSTGSRELHANRDAAAVDMAASAGARQRSATADSTRLRFSRAWADPNLPEQHEPKHDPKSNIRYDELCLLEHQGDPTGVRALQDHKRQKECPLKKISDGNEDCTKRIDQRHGRLLNIFERLGVQVSNAKLEEYANLELKRYDCERFQRLMELCPKFEQCKSLAQAAKNKNAVAFGQFSLQVDLLDELSQDGAIKRGAMYRRVAHPEEVDNCKTTIYQKIVYIAGPMLLFCFAFAVQSFLLHVATHFYVEYMENGPEERRKSEGMLFDLGAEFVAGSVREFKAVEGDGAVSNASGRVQVPLWALDASGVIPGLFCGCSFLRSLYQGHFHIGLWTKAFLVASIVAVFKGVFDAVTIIPDSIGWEACKARLTKDGLDQMESVHWRSKNFWMEGLFKALWNEIFGIEGGRVRYCADMLLSGHTYFAVTFSLAAYRQISYNTSFFSFTSNEAFNHNCNWWGRRLIRILLISCVVAEVCLVTAARFHYSVDMLVAIILVCLLFDSMHVEQWSADWSAGYLWKTRDVEDASGQKTKILQSQAHEVLNFKTFRCFMEPEENDILSGGDGDEQASRLLGPA